MEIAHSSQTCPTCGGQYPVHQGELPWCHHCNWNIQGDLDNDKAKTAYQKAYLKIGKKLSENLFDDLVKTGITRPRMHAEKILAYSFATLIHLSSLMLLPLAFLCVTHLSLWVGVPLALVLCLIVWNALPKPRKWPDDIVSREKFPELYLLAEKVAREMNTAAPVKMAVSADFNAYYTEYGFGPWKKKLINLGLPLLIHLSGAEIIAILAHETSHGANGDVSRGIYFGTAVRALANWYYMLRPHSITEGQTYVTGGPIAAWISNLTGWLVSFIPLSANYILARLLFRQSQEAEYLADRLATEVCGTDAMISALSKLSLSSTFESVLQQAALSKEDINVFDSIQKFPIRERSSHEKERRSRLEIFRGLSLDATHPPSAYRRAFLQKTTFEPKVILDAESSKRFHQELATLKLSISAKLKDQYRDNLYYGRGA